MKLDHKTLKFLFSQNLIAEGQVYVAAGLERVILEFDTFQKYIDDHELFCADYFGVTREQYQQYMNCLLYTSPSPRDRG